MKKEIKKICIECGKEFFVAVNSRAKICSDACREKRKAEQDRIRQQGFHSPINETRKNIAKRHNNSSQSLSKIAKEALKARDEFGRPMSYGKYVAMKECYT